ncbi:hypothetical protein CALCODRAFT_72577 [Calocera cornea HHB12733]|uniref:Uncharacterized protein n=1 Tax=Calocera cornea HHB12733 TaxID=1353952 RepID=A0A165IT85_9BASI|nr:hypothetical protein CALCODRAFT_72577 [Calocera cornea HHB12733]
MTAEHAYATSKFSTVSPFAPLARRTNSQRVGAPVPPSWLPISRLSSLLSPYLPTVGKCNGLALFSPRPRLSRAAHPAGRSAIRQSQRYDCLSAARPRTYPGQARLFNVRYHLGRLLLMILSVHPRICSKAPVSLASTLRLRRVGGRSESL